LNANQLEELGLKPKSKEWDVNSKY
jgi:hypothetical protein